MNRRNLLTLILGLLAVPCLSGLLLFIEMVGVRSERSAAHANSERQLAAASDAQAMNKVVGDLGIVFHIQDGSWIAVRYVDRHNGAMWSSAVALDSEGRWYQSDEHYCGTFKIYRQHWDRTVEILSTPGVAVEEKKSWVESSPLQPAKWAEIENAQNLEQAVVLLIASGFRQYESDNTPRMSGPWPQPIESKKTAIDRMLR